MNLPRLWACRRQNWSVRVLVEVKTRAHVKVRPNHVNAYVLAASACSRLAYAILRRRHLSSSPVAYQHSDLRETRGELAAVEELRKRPHASDALARAR
jgi:hypothetical protein